MTCEILCAIIEKITAILERKMDIAEITKKMIACSDGNLHDICHFLKVYAYAKTIGNAKSSTAVHSSPLRLPR